MELVSSQGIHTAEELGLKGSQEAARQEIAAAAQTGVRTGVEQLEEKIAQITRRTVNSVVTAVAAAKGYDSVKINSNGTVTGKYTPIGSRIAVSTTCGDKGCTTN